MESSGLPTERVSRVVGLASSVLFDPDNPRGAVNRRISIVVLTQQAEQDANKTDLPATQRAAAESNAIPEATAKAIPGATAEAVPAAVTAPAP
jgi:chemotaxis protein MotB